MTGQQLHQEPLIQQPTLFGSALPAWKQRWKGQFYLAMDAGHEPRAQIMGRTLEESWGEEEYQSEGRRLRLAGANPETVRSSLTGGLPSQSQNPHLCSLAPLPLAVCKNLLC